jgi:hypothetical protein
MPRVRPLVLLTAALAGLLVPAGAAPAHDLNARVTVGPYPERNVPAGEVRVEAWYGKTPADADPADAARVTVTDAARNVVATGTLDDRGVWTFPRPGPGRYTVAVESVGHRAEVEFDAPGEHTGWRLDRRLGLAIGLGVLLGGTLLYWLVRRSRVRMRS